MRRIAAKNMKLLLKLAIRGSIENSSPGTGTPEIIQIVYETFGEITENDSLDPVQLLHDRVKHRKYILQDEAFTFLVVEAHAVIIAEPIGRLDDSWRFRGTIQAP